MADGDGEKPPLTREERLNELELYERIQEKILKWAKMRFWWIVVFGTLALGSGGYGIIQAMLADANKAAIEANIKAKLAGDATLAASKEAKAARMATAEAQTEVKRVTELLKKLKTESDELRESSEELRRLLDGAREQAKAYEARIKQIEADGSRVSTKQEELKRFVESAKVDWDQRIAALNTKLETVSKIADPEDLATQRILEQFRDVSKGFAERTQALNALMQSGDDGVTEGFIDELWKEFDEASPIDADSEEDYWIRALAESIIVISGRDGLIGMLKILENAPSYTYAKSKAAGMSLKVFSNTATWRMSEVELLREVFDVTNFSAKDDVIQSFLYVSLSFASEEVKKAALDFLVYVIEGDVESGVVAQLAAFAIERNFQDVGGIALPRLKAALAQYGHDEFVLDALEGAIKAIESYSPKIEATAN